MKDRIKNEERFTLKANPPCLKAKSFGPEGPFSERFCSSGKAAGPRRAQAYCSTSSIVDGPRTQPGSKIAAKRSV